MSGLVVATGTNSLLLDLGTRQSTGWFAMVMGAVAVLVAVPPSFVRSERVTRVE